MAPGRPAIFGEVLFDCFPDGSRVLGGAPFNVAWHLQALGLAPHFVSRVGADAAGAEVLAEMREWGMDTSGVERDPAHPTGQVVVSLVGGEPRYDIVPDQAYDHITLHGEAPADAPLLYHGSLALRSPASRAALDRLKASTRAPVFLDVNLRDPWWDAAGVSRLIDGARWCKLNGEELTRLAGPGGIEERGRRLIERHDLDWIFVTRGAAGAVALSRDGAVRAVAPPREAPVVDTVGAGDAFSAALITGILGGWAVETMLSRAQGLASAVCGVRGAVARDRGFYSEVTRAWRTP